MLKDLNFSLFDVINKVRVDKYGQVSGFFALKKPVGITSHDLVDQVRRVLRTRQVGHVGALDPFASGVMFVLVGRDFTRLSDQLMELDKQYQAEILFGIATDTQDIEGQISGKSEIKEFNFELLKIATSKFEGGYRQYVPVFSSVKINGQKLRILARESEKFEFSQGESGIRKVEFFKKSGNNVIIDLPYRDVVMTNLEILNTYFLTNENNEFLKKAKLDGQFPVVSICFDCSKGTYVRQFAVDLGDSIGQKAMLVGLSRTKIGEVSIADCIDVSEISPVEY